MQLQKLAKEYRKSLKLLNSRIKELETLKDDLQSASLDPEKDPEIIELKERLKPLKSMQTDLIVLSREVQHYYERSWYRSPDFTFNRKKGQGQQYTYGG